MSNFNFDQEYDISGNNFIRTNKDALRILFGGEDISPFWIADMEYAIDENIINEIKRVADRGVFSYEKPLDDFYPIMCDWFRNRHNLDLDPNKFEIVTGVLTGIAVVLQEFSNEGDEVVIQTPVYHVFKKLIEGNNRRAVSNSLKLIDGVYRMDLDDLENKLKTGKVKVLIVCNPHNPMGRVWSKDELQAVVELAKKYDVFLMSDEIHSDIIHEGHTFNSIIQFGYDKSASLLGSPAKTFGMQGSSAGFIYCYDESIQRRLHKKIEAMYLFHLSTLTVHATRMAYLKAGPWLDAMVDYVQGIIKTMTQFIDERLEGVKVIAPQGTYQVWLDFRALGLSNEELDQLILHKAGVGLTPGYWFGEEGAGFMRMNIGAPKHKVIQALEEIETVLR